MKLENFKNERGYEGADGEQEKQHFNYQENDEDDFEQLYGVENEYTREMKDKILLSKKNKGRGLLLSFYEFN